MLETIFTFLEDSTGLVLGETSSISISYGRLIWHENYVPRVAGRVNDVVPASPQLPPPRLEAPAVDPRQLLQTRMMLFYNLSGVQWEAALEQLPLDVRTSLATQPPPAAEESGSQATT